MDKSTDLRLRQVTTPHTTDDESITTSTASDTLDSWTLVTDKKNVKPTKPIHEDESNVEDLPKYEDLDLETSQSTAKEEQENEPSPEHNADTTSATDEFSDEVSIISESESGDILTPHPYLREHLHTLNLKFTTGEGLDLASLLQQQQQEERRLQQRNDETTPPNLPIQLQQQQSFNVQNNSNNGTRQRKRRSPSVDATPKTLKAQTATPPVPINSQAPCTLRSPLVIRRVYTLFFYTIIALTLLGLYGKLGMEWPILNRHSSSSIDTLEKKLIDMELQNNLMRAEIDILSKQVNYLNTIGDKDDKKFQPNKEKKNYRYRETRYEDTIMRDSNIKNNFETPNLESTTVASDTTGSESTAPPTQNPAEQPATEENYKPEASMKNNNEDFISRERFNKHNSREKRDFASRNNDDKFRKRDEKVDNSKWQTIRHNSKERYDDNTEEHKNFKKTFKENNSKEKKYKKEDNEYKRFNNPDSKEHYNKNDNSKDRKNKRSDTDRNSKEHYHTHDNSKEQRRRRKFHSDERFDGEKEKNSGEWHEKLMQHRENARHEREEHMKREKNWYLNRNDGREQWRNDEANRR